VRHAPFLALVFAATLVTPALHAQTPEDRERASEPVLRQLEAFRRGDYDLAYTFASTEIQSLFDRLAFERMVRSGYPEIADSASARVMERRIAPDGHLLLVLKIRGANGRHIEALYDMVWEAGMWKVNGVVARPDPGETTIDRHGRSRFKDA
jgi:hypothetical protein